MQADNRVTGMSVLAAVLYACMILTMLNCPPGTSGLKISYCCMSLIRKIILDPPPLFSLLPSTFKGTLSQEKQKTI